MDWSALVVYPVLLLNMSRSDLRNRSEARAATSGVTASPPGAALPCFSLQYRPHERRVMAKKKIDPLNRKQYSAVSAALTVSDIPAAVSFYQKAFGFSKRGIMNGPDGKPMHAELTLRGTTLMLGPESPAMGRRSAKSVGASPASLYIYVENVDKVVEKATKLGGTSQGPIMDMFWGDRCGTVIDPDGYAWMVGTHKAEPTAKEMKKGMEEMMKQSAGAAAAD
jgi:PhnB protein